jgi:hypothetical protein
MLTAFIIRASPEILKKYDLLIWTGFVWSRRGDQWRALVSTVMNRRVPLKMGLLE